VQLTEIYTSVSGLGCPDGICVLNCSWPHDVDGGGSEIGLDGILSPRVCHSGFAAANLYHQEFRCKMTTPIDSEDDSLGASVGERKNAWAYRGGREH
jgi:hypothetical protein